jgi:hypothetical protein
MLASLQLCMAHTVLPFRWERAVFVLHRDSLRMFDSVSIGCRCLTSRYIIVFCSQGETRDA